MGSARAGDVQDVKETLAVILTVGTNGGSLDVHEGARKGTVSFDGVRSMPQSVAGG